MAWLLCAAMLGGCSGLPFRLGPLPDKALDVQVQHFLRADDREAARLLPELVAQPPDALAVALQHVLARRATWEGDGASIQTGLLPGRLIRVGGSARSYGLYVPPSYRPSRAYPLIICLHGAGFGGDSYLERWQPRLGEDYLLACPSIEAGTWWTREGEDVVLAVLDEVTRRYHVDLDRIVLTGMSNGGLGTYLIGLNHADRFAALVPMAAPFPRGFYPLFENAQRTPFYLIHGAQDAVIPVFFSRHVADYLQKEGYAVVYREHELTHPMAGGHFFPKEELPALVAWLTQQKRQMLPPQIVVVRDRDHLERSRWVRLDEIDPEIASFWASEHDAEEGKRLEAGAYARLAARVEGNTVVVETKGIRRYSLLFPPGLIDFSRPVRVLTNSQVTFDGMVTPDGRRLLEEARRQPDPSRLVLAVLEVAVPPPSP